MKIFTKVVIFIIFFLGSPVFGGLIQVLEYDAGSRTQIVVVGLLPGEENSTRIPLAPSPWDGNIDVSFEPGQANNSNDMEIGIPNVTSHRGNPNDFAFSFPGIQHRAYMIRIKNYSSSDILNGRITVHFPRLISVPLRPRTVPYRQPRR